VLLVGAGGEVTLVHDDVIITLLGLLGLLRLLRLLRGSPLAVEVESHSSEDDNQGDGSNHDASNGSSAERGGCVDTGGGSSLVKGDTLGGILEGGTREIVSKGLQGGGVGAADEGVDLGGEGGGSRVGGGHHLEVDDNAARRHAQDHNLVRADLKEGHDEGNEGLIESHRVVRARRVPGKVQVGQLEGYSHAGSIGGGGLAVGAREGGGAEADVGARGRVRAGAAIGAGRGAAGIRWDRGGGLSWRG